MTDTADVSAQAQATAEEHSKPGKFSFLDRLANRNYPTEEVEVYLDEEAGYEIQKLDAALQTAKPEDVDAFEEKLEALREAARGSRYIVHLEGVSTETYDGVVDAALEEFPMEYNEARNPLTFKLEREEIPSEGREIFFRTHLWSAFIRKVEDADGNVDDDITPEWVAGFMKMAPIIAQARIAGAVDALRMTTDWMDKIQGEDFLAKS